jgi:hypothetical protein
MQALGMLEGPGDPFPEAQSRRRNIPAISHADNIERSSGRQRLATAPENNRVDGGRSGIRTHERVAPLTVFKTVAFVRSAILPRAVSQLSGWAIQAPEPKTTATRRPPSYGWAAAFGLREPPLTPRSGAPPARYGTSPWHPEIAPPATGLRSVSQRSVRRPELSQPEAREARASRERPTSVSPIRRRACGSRS